jgi:hypothetical protein
MGMCVVHGKERKQYDMFIHETMAMWNENEQLCDVN